LHNNKDKEEDNYSDKDKLDNYNLLEDYNHKDNHYYYHNLNLINYQLIIIIHYIHQD